MVQSALHTGPLHYQLYDEKSIEQNKKNAEPFENPEQKNRNPKDQEEANTKDRIIK